MLCICTFGFVQSNFVTATNCSCFLNCMYFSYLTLQSCSNNYSCDLFTAIFDYGDSERIVTANHLQTSLAQKYTDMELLDSTDTNYNVVKDH